MYSAVSGNVGIGVTVPYSRLDVRGTGVDDGALFQLSNSDRSHFINLYAGRSGDPNPYVQWKDGDPLRFSTDGGGWSEKMRITSDGNELILCMPGPGEPFCPVTLLDGGPQLGTAFAVSDVSLLHCNRQAFDALCEKYPEVLSAVRAACLGEVRRLAQRLELRSFASLKKRLAAVLLDATRIQAQQGGPLDLLNITHIVS